MMARIEERLPAIEKRLEGLPAPSQDGTAVEDLERRVRYLQAEPERRDREQEGQKKHGRR